MLSENQPESVGRSAILTIPELEQSKAAVLNTLASQHSRRSYEYAIERFITWYCSEPRLTFNRSVVVKYRSFLERLWTEQQDHSPRLIHHAQHLDRPARRLLLPSDC